MSITINGHITAPGQPESGFMLDPSTGTYSQWGAGLEVLGSRVEYLEAMIEGLTESSDYFEQEYSREPLDLGPDTEIGQKRATMAQQLIGVATGLTWEEAEPEMQENYLADALDMIMALPHMLTLPERERLMHQFPQLAI